MRGTPFGRREGWRAWGGTQPQKWKCTRLLNATPYELETVIMRVQLTDTHRSEVTAKKSFSESLYVGNEFVQGYHDRKSLEHQYEEGGGDKAADAQCQSLVGETIKRHPCTYVHERSNVEQQIYY